MASLKIIRPPLCADRADQVPREQWAELISERRNFCQQVLPSDCRMLLFFVDDAQGSQWLGYGSRDEYLRNGLGLDPQQVRWAIDGLQQIQPNKPIGYDWAQKLGKRGGDRRSEKARADQPSNRNLIKGGTNRAYILARLDRDGHVELAAKVRAGNLSANAAANEAGFRKKPKKRLTHCPHCGGEL